MQSSHVRPHLSSTLKLYMSEESRKNILEIVKQLTSSDNKRNKMMKGVRHTFAKLKSEFQQHDIGKDWEHCIKQIETKSPDTMIEYWNNLCVVAEKNKLFRINKMPGVNAGSEYELCVAVFTALTKSLFTQFALEKDLYKCSQYLHDSLTAECGKYVNWQLIDSDEFISRLTNEWSAFKPLYQYFTSLGINTNDFINSFFSSNNIITQSSSNVEMHNTDILTCIAGYLSGAELHVYRQACRANYHVIEQHYALRMRHRLHLISTSTVLETLVGTELYSDNDYLLTNPADNNEGECKYRITAMKTPYLSTTYSIKQDDCVKFMGGYVYTDTVGRISILTTYGNDMYVKNDIVYNSQFNVMRVTANSLQDLSEQSNIKTIKICNIPRSVYDETSIVKTVNFRKQDNNITLDVKLMKCKKNNDKNSRDKLSTNRLCFWESSRHYHAEFKLSDFETIDASVEAKKLTGVLKSI